MKPISANVYTRMHWTQREQIKTYLWHLVQQELRQQKRTRLFQGKVDLLLIAHFQGRQALDSTNLFVTLKLIEDAIKQRLIVDDSPTYVGVVSCLSRTCCRRSYLELVITPHHPGAPHVYMTR